MQKAKPLLSCGGWLNGWLSRLCIVSKRPKIRPVTMEYDQETVDLEATRVSEMIADS